MKTRDGSDEPQWWHYGKKVDQPPKYEEPLPPPYVDIPSVYDIEKHPLPSAPPEYEKEPSVYDIETPEKITK